MGESNSLMEIRYRLIVHLSIQCILIQTKEKLMKDSGADEIAPAVARCHAPRKTRRVLKKAMPMRFKKTKNAGLVIQPLPRNEFVVALASR